MTPAELNLYINADRKRREDEQRLTCANLYLLASLNREMNWSKHPRDFSQIFPEERKENMSDEQMYVMVKGLNALFGGKEAD